MIIRRAEASDLDFLVELYADEDVRPFLAGGGRYDADALAAEIGGEPSQGELLVIEVDAERAGAMRWRLESERNRIAHLSGIAVHPSFRGRRVADEAARLLQRRLIRGLGFHRLQLEVYGFNERAMRHAERSGFVREGVKRKAYLRHGEWVDGVLYGLIPEDLEPGDDSSNTSTRGTFDRHRAVCEPRRVGLHRGKDLDLKAVTDHGDPDDWRPNSAWALVAEAEADLAVIVETLGVGDAIPLHRHRIDEVILYLSGEAEVRVGEAAYDVSGGDIVVVPAGRVHGTRNTGTSVVALRAVFPSARIDIEYVERNPAPGTEGDPPRPGVVWDTRTGLVEPLDVDGQPRNDSSSAPA